MERIEAIQRQNGVTLIELMVVITIIAILAAIATLSTDLIRKEQVLSKTKEVLADLQRTRVDGMVTGPTSTTGAFPFMRGAGIRLVTPSDYVIFKFNDCNEDNDYDVDGCSGEREEADAKTTTLPSSIEILRDTGGGLVAPANTLNDIRIFDRLGFLRSTNWSSATGTELVVRHKTAGHTKCITISTNRIREGHWDGTTCKEQ